MPIQLPATLGAKNLKPELIEPCCPLGYAQANTPPITSEGRREAAYSEFNISEDELEKRF